eukprot:SAG31_NODE_120_length_23892_cov_10.545623_4_plen_107_part_00
MTSTKLANEGFMFWEDWAGQVGLPDDEVASFRQVRGVILVSDSSRRFVEAVLPHHEALGIPFVRWDREEVERQVSLHLPKTQHPCSATERALHLHGNDNHSCRSSI